MTELGELNRDESIDRRRFLRRVGTTVVWATPLVITLTGSRAGAQNGCLTEGTTCSTTSPPDCCSPYVCCPAGSANAGTCKIPNGGACSGNGNCCSKKCQGSPKLCVA